ncbi:MAG: hypothetical protein Q6M04_10735, partial [Thermostichus sp. BF3_bins_97]
MLRQGSLDSASDCSRLDPECDCEFFMLDGIPLASFDLNLCPHLLATLAESEALDTLESEVIK